VNAPVERGTTPLTYAAGFGSVEAMKILIDAGANVNSKNAFDATALMWSVQDSAKVRLLLEKGADVNVRSKPGRTALLLAAFQDGSDEVVRMLLAKGADLTTKDNFDVTVLVAAANANNTSVARMAIEKGLNVNQKSSYPASALAGATPLSLAASYGNTELVRLLIAKGADVNAVSAPPAFPVKNGIVNLGDFTPLMLASTYGPPEVVRMLLEAGAKVDARDHRGMTPLHFAVSSETQNREIVRLLLDKGAEPAAKMETEETAADWVRKFEHPDMAELFHVTAANHSGSAVTEVSASKNDARSAAQKGVALLEEKTSSFFKTGGCASCHAHDITGVAVGAAKKTGLKINTELEKERLAQIRSQWLSVSDGLMLRLDAPATDINLYSLIGLAASGQEPNLMTDAIARNIAVQQQRDGSWRFGGVARVPIEESDITRTAFAISAINHFLPKGCERESAERIDRARRWLLAAQPSWNEERTMQILGLKWAREDDAVLRSMARDVMAEQRPDGGWAQTRYLASDAYATGQTLYALHETKMLSVSDPVYQRGVAYLLRTQHEDGSWYVKSRAPKFQPYFQSGFPYDHDQWISQMATGWATAAVVFAVEPQKQVAAR
jgi:ankyrin repeat protein